MEKISTIEELLQDPSSASTEYLKEKSTETRAAMVKCLSQQIPEASALQNDIRVCKNEALKLDGALSSYLERIDNMEGDVKELVIKATEYSGCIKNRKDINHKLKTHFHSVSINPKIIKEMIEGEVDENYIDFVSVLEIKRRFVLEKKNCGELSEIPSMNDVVPIIQMLQTIVIYFFYLLVYLFCNSVLLLLFSAPLFNSYCPSFLFTFSLIFLPNLILKGRNSNSSIFIGQDVSNHIAYLQSSRNTKLFTFIRCSFW